MQGVGEKGCDVVVHDTSGNLLEIIQCKNLRGRLSLPDLLKEFVKLALHSHLEPKVLGANPIRYELWAPQGVTGDAIKFFQGWPGSWERETVELTVPKVQSQYKSLSAIIWSEAAESVFNDFPTRIDVRLIAGDDIDSIVKESPLVMRDYFETKVVADIGDLFRGLPYSLRRKSGE